MSLTIKPKQLDIGYDSVLPASIYERHVVRTITRARVFVAYIAKSVDWVTIARKAACIGIIEPILGADDTYYIVVERRK